MPHLAVSIVIPTYDRAHLLERALRTALAECRPGDEIIVADDGSTDDTEAVARAFGPPVRYLRGAHHGAGEARNAGIRAATGDLVAFLDSDDEWVSGKLSWQRTVLEQCPDILFVFSDFGAITSSGERLPHRQSTWHGDTRPWDDILGPGIASATIAGMPASAPPFALFTGRLYEAYIHGFYVYTCTVVVRREEAGPALRFAEDVGIYEDYECFARLAARGLAGYMDCDTAWQHGHLGGRLTDADPATSADAAVKIIGRVWGSDEEYLKLHREEFENVVDGYRLHKVRYLLGTGRRREARQELAEVFRAPWQYPFLTCVPGKLMRCAVRIRGASARYPRSKVLRVTTPTWRIVEYRGRSGLERLEADWRRLYAAMPNRSRYHAYEAQLAYHDHLCAAPTLCRYLALTDGQRVRAICPLEAREDRSLGYPLRVWGLPWHPHWVVTDVLCPEDEARPALVPALVGYLRKKPDGRRLLVLGPLPEGSVLWEGLRAMGHGEYCRHLTEPSCVFDCAKPYDELMSRLTKHFRRNLRSHRNKLPRLEDVRFVTVSGQDGLETELESFMAVEASGWKGEGGTGSAIRLHPRLTAFYRDLASSMLGDEDHCEINSLYVAGRCVASQFCVRTGGDYTILKIGYDEASARLGPGQLLLDRTLERCCCAPSVERLDLVTAASWCGDWRTEQLPMQQAQVAIGRWSGRPLIALLRLRYGLGRRIVRRVRGTAEQ